MNKLHIFSGLTILLIGVSTAQASDFAGPYVGAKVGANFSSATSLDNKTSLTAGLEAGYNWDVQDNFLLGFSGYYDNNAKSTHSGSGGAPVSVDFGSQVYGLNLKLGLPSGPWMPYAKLGYAQVNGVGDNYVSQFKNDTLGYGLGLEYKLMSNLGIAIEWDGNNAKHNDVTLHNNNLTVGVNYYFGTPEPAPIVAVQPPPPPPPPPAPQYKTVITSKPVTLKGTNFATASAKLNSTAFSQLDKVVQFAKRYPDADLAITGYTDSRGSAKMNQSLSEHRAESVKAYLVGKGVAADRITTQGEGEANPIASNATAAGRAQNRRVEIRSVIHEKHQVQVNS